MLLKTLGGLGLEGSGFARPKPLLLLAYLALEGPKSRREVAELFWLEAASPRDSLSTALRRLNAVEPELVVADGPRLSTGVMCDAKQLLLALEAAGERGHDEFERVLGLYGGPFLAGLDLSLGEELEEWVYTTRERLGAQLRHARLHLAQAAYRAGEFPRAREHAEQALALSEAGEWGAEDLAQLHQLLVSLASPRVRDVQRLADEVGIPLMRATTEASQGAGEAESARPTGVPVHLPSVATSFVGRREELGRIADAILDPKLRLLTLHGPGGVGKSRLALQAAREALDIEAFPGGLYFVALEPLAHAQQVAPAIAATVGVQLLPQPAPLEQVMSALGDKPVLLVLDNVEHLLPLDDLIPPLLSQCPALKLLVTSRVRLNLHEEHVLPLAGLSVHEGADDGEALTLFAERARKTRLDFTLSAADLPAARQVCELVHGFPLGIELAASWVHVLPVPDIARHIEANLAFLASTHADVPERQQSIRAVLEHSWKLLPYPAKTALRRLAVFQGGFTKEAAQTVADVDLEGLRTLVDASLLSVTEAGRFERHPLVFEFSREKLAEHPEEASNYRQRHADYFLDLLLSQEMDMLGGPQLPVAGQLIDTEWPNITQAWEWMLGNGESERLAHTGLVLLFYCEVRGRYQEVDAICQQTVEARQAQAETDLAWAAALGVKAYTQFRMSNLDAALEAGPAAVKAVQGRTELGANIATFVGAVTAANVAIVQGDFTAATERISWALEAGRREQRKATTPSEHRRGDVMAGGAHEIWGMAETLSGNHEAALAQLLPGEALLRKQQSPILCNILWHLGQVYMSQGDYEAARRWLDEGLDLTQAIGYRTIEALIAVDLAKLTYELGELEQTESLAHLVLQRAAELRVADLTAGAYALLGRVAAARSLPHQALAHYQQGLAAVLPSGAPFYAMELLVAASDTLVSLGQADLAAGVLRYVGEHPGTPQLTRLQAQEELRRLAASEEEPATAAPIASLAEVAARVFALTPEPER